MKFHYRFLGVALTWLTWNLGEKCQNCQNHDQNSEWSWNLQVNKLYVTTTFLSFSDHIKCWEHDVFFWFPDSELHFEASCGVFLAKKSKMPFFHAKNGIFELKLASLVVFCHNMPPCAKKMCLRACKLQKHIQTIPKPKGLR